MANRNMYITLLVTFRISSIHSPGMRDITNNENDEVFLKVKRPLPHTTGDSLKHSKTIKKCHKYVQSVKPIVFS